MQNIRNNYIFGKQGTLIKDELNQIKYSTDSEDEMSSKGKIGAILPYMRDILIVPTSAVSAQDRLI